MICYVLAMGKQHLGPHAVVGYGIKIFWPGLFITSPDHLAPVRSSPSVNKRLMPRTLISIHVPSFNLEWGAKYGMILITFSLLRRTFTQYRHAEHEAIIFFSKRKIFELFSRA